MMKFCISPLSVQNLSIDMRYKPDLKISKKFRKMIIKLRKQKIKRPIIGVIMSFILFFLSSSSIFATDYIYDFMSGGIPSTYWTGNSMTCGSNGCGVTSGGWYNQHHVNTDFFDGTYIITFKAIQSGANIRMDVASNGSMDSGCQIQTNMSSSLGINCNAGTFSRSYTSGNIYTLKIVRSGNTCSFYFGNEFLGSSTVASAGGYWSFGTYNAQLIQGMTANISDPEPTPTPTTQPTPTPTTQPTPTPTTQPTPTPTGTVSEYYHRVCVYPETRKNTIYEDGEQTSVINLPYTNENPLIWGVFNSYGFDVSSLDLNDLQNKIFTGFQISPSNLSFTTSNGSTSILQRFCFGTALDINSCTTLFNGQMGYDLTSSTAYTCNSVLPYMSFLEEQTFSDLFDNSGFSANSANLKFGGSLTMPNFSLDNYGVCFVYKDNDPTGAVDLADDCIADPELPPPEVVTCTLTFENGVLSGVGDYTSCLINKFRSMFTSLFIPSDDFADRLGDYFSENSPIVYNGAFSSLVTNFLFIPINTIDSVRNTTCQSLQYPITWFNATIPLPCPRSYLQEFFGDYFIIWDILAGGYISYYLILNLIKHVISLFDADDQGVKTQDI